jgi:hypothetical protein
MMGVGGHSLDAEQQCLLQGLDIGIFAADPHGGAPLTMSSLFTLIAKHWASSGRVITSRAENSGVSLRPTTQRSGQFLRTAPMLSNPQTQYTTSLSFYRFYEE